MGSWQMKRKKNLHGMIGPCHLISFKNSSDFKEKGKYRYFNHNPSSDSMSRVFLTLKFMQNLGGGGGGGGGGKTSCVMGDV